MLTFEKITKEDIWTISNISKLSLPIWLNEDELKYYLTHENYINLKMCLNNYIIGYMITEDKNNNEYHIVSIATDRKYRGKGYTTSFLNYFKDKWNCNKISLFVQTNNEKAISFYEKNNFKKKKYLKDYYHSLIDTEAFYYEYAKNV